MTIQVYCDPCTVRPLSTTSIASQLTLSQVNSRKVLAGLEEMNADYHQNYINYFTGEHKGADFAKINPHKTVYEDPPPLTTTS